MSKRVLGTTLWNIAMMVAVLFNLLVWVPGIGIWLIQTFGFTNPIPVTAGVAYDPGDPSLRPVIVDLAALVVGISFVGMLAGAVLKRVLPPAYTWFERQTLWRVTLCRTVFAVIAWIVASAIFYWWHGYSPWDWLALGARWIPAIFLFQGSVTGAAWFTPDPRSVRPFTFLTADEVAGVQAYRSSTHSCSDPPCPDSSANG